MADATCRTNARENGPSPERTMVDTPCGTDDGETSSEESVQEAPSRMGNRYKVKCPRCGRKVALKTLKYSHKCPIMPCAYVNTNYRAAAQAAWDRNDTRAPATVPHVVRESGPTTVPPTTVPATVPRAVRESGPTTVPTTTVPHVAPAPVPSSRYSTLRFV